MASPGVGRRQRLAPRATIVVGIPAYAVVLGFSVRDMVRQHPAPVVAVAVAAVAVFSVLFLWLAIDVPSPALQRARLRPIIVLAALALGLALLGATTSLYLITVGALAGNWLRPRVAVVFIGLATLGTLTVCLAHHFKPQDTVTQTVVGLVIGLMTYVVSRMAETNAELMAAREELAHLAVVSERLRFSRDLHDLLGHSLTVIRAKSELASRIAEDDPSRAGREMAEVEAVARQALSEVRDAVGGYRRPTLGAEVANARAALAAAGIDAEVAADGLTIGSDLDETLGWVLREAVTNVVRHSGAQRCVVEAVADDGGVRLEVVDDGLGRAAAVNLGHGLTGARERLAAVGGTLELANAPGRGFRVLARVPSRP